MAKAISEGGVVTKKNILLILAVLLGLECLRESITLKALGFEPKRFIEWVKGGDGIG